MSAIDNVLQFARARNPDIKDNIEAIEELAQLRADKKFLAGEVAKYIARSAQFKALSDEMFQSLAAVLGDDEHRGHVTQITIESCRNAVSHWLKLTQKKEKP